MSVSKGLYELGVKLLGLVPLLRTKELASAAMSTASPAGKGGKIYDEIKNSAEFDEF